MEKLEEDKKKEQQQEQQQAERTELGELKGSDYPKLLRKFRE